MTMTIAAVMYSSVESKPENTLAKSAKYPPGPVTYALSPPASALAIERNSSTIGVSSSQPFPSSATLMGTTTCNARPSSDEIGPKTSPLTSLTPAKRLASASLGSHADASFYWALLSLPASDPATANTATQKPRTNHLVRHPPGKPANLRTPPMTPPGIRHLLPITQRGHDIS